MWGGGGVPGRRWDENIQGQLYHFSHFPFTKFNRNPQRSFLRVQLICSVQRTHKIRHWSVHVLPVFYTWDVTSDTVSQKKKGRKVWHVTFRGLPTSVRVVLERRILQLRRIASIRRFSVGIFKSYRSIALGLVRRNVLGMKKTFQALRVTEEQTIGTFIQCRFLWRARWLGQRSWEHIPSGRADP